MESEYLELDIRHDDNQSNRNNAQAETQKKNAIGKSKDSDKKKHFNVIHKDGSLADLPGQDAPGTGAQEGTVGLGH